MSFCHMRIARPVSELTPPPACIAPGWDSSCSAALPIEGFSGIMLGAPEAGWHLNSPTAATIRHPSPGDEDLLVLYYPQQAAWEAQCAAMDAAGFLRVTAFNPTGGQWRHFVDRDGYRTVLQTAPGHGV